MMAGALLLSACDDSFIDPFSNEDRFFTVYGFLDQLETEHAVRVIPVTRRAEVIRDPSEPQASIDAQVFSIDVRTGATERWEHSLERLDNGNLGHIFRGRFRVLEGRTYRLEVRRSDGVITSAETTVPRLPATKPNPDTLFFPFEVSPDAGLSQEVSIADLVSPWDIILTYDLQGTAVRLPYGRVGTRTDEGWRFTVDLQADAPRMRQVLGLTDTAPLPLLHAICLQVRLLDQQWDPPQGLFDAEILAQPGTLSNVENGYGFFGSIGLYQYTWIQPPQS